MYAASPAASGRRFTDWLGRGGPFGAMLGFAIGGVLLLPVGYVYGQSSIKTTQPVPIIVPKPSAK